MTAHRYWCFTLTWRHRSTRFGSCRDAPCVGVAELAAKLIVEHSQRTQLEQARTKIGERLDVGILHQRERAGTLGRLPTGAG